MQRIPVKKANDLSISSQSPLDANTKSERLPELNFTLSLASQLISLSQFDLSKAMRFTDHNSYSLSFPHHACQAQLLLYHQERNNLQTAQGKLLDLVTKKAQDKTQKAKTLYKKSSILLNDQVLQPSPCFPFLPNLTTTVVSASKKAENQKKLRQSKTKIPALTFKIDSLRL